MLGGTTSEPSSPQQRCPACSTKAMETQWRLLMPRVGQLLSGISKPMVCQTDGLRAGRLSRIGTGRSTVGKCTGPKWSERPFWSKWSYSKPDFGSQNGPKWSFLVHFGLKWSILVHLGPPTVLWPFLNENDGNHEKNNENDEDNSDNYKQGVQLLSGGFTEFTDTAKRTKTTGIQGANHGLE